MNCKSCGGALKAGAKFCSQCGTVVGPDARALEAAPSMTSKRCPKCGAENPVTARFCRVDGQALANDRVAAVGADLDRPQDRTSTASVVSATAGPVPGTIKCPRCGAANPVGARFCKTDGTALAVGIKESSPPEPRKVAVNTTQPNSVAAGHPGQVERTRPPASDTRDQKEVPASRPPTAMAPDVRSEGPATATQRPTMVPGEPSVIRRPESAVQTPKEKPSAPSRRAAVHEASTATSAPAPVLERKGLSKSVIGAAIATTLILIGAGLAYLYWSGVVGDRRGTIGRELTANVEAQGFNDVTVTVNEEWVAVASGTVESQAKRKTIEDTLRARSGIRDVQLEGLAVKVSAADIQAAVAQALEANGLSYISAEVTDDGRVTLTGRAQEESDIDKANKAAGSVDGVTAIESRIGVPFVVLEREINQALIEAGYPDIAVRIGSETDISITGTLRDEGERPLLVAKVAEVAGGLGEAVDPAVFRDEMIVEAPMPSSAPAGTVASDRPQAAPGAAKGQKSVASRLDALVTTSLAEGRNCLKMLNFECAIARAETVLQLDPENAGAVALRDDAKEARKKAFEESELR